MLLSRFKCRNLTCGLIIPKCERACGVEWLVYEWQYKYCKLCVCL